MTAVTSAGRPGLAQICVCALLRVAAGDPGGWSPVSGGAALLQGATPLLSSQKPSQLPFAGMALGVGTGVHTMGCVVPQDLLHILI